MANYTSKVVAPDETWQLGAGDTAQYTSVYGVYSLSNGAIDSAATVFGGGAEAVSSGGISYNATISGGAMTVFSAGIVSGLTLNSDAWAGVSQGGFAANVSVSADALLNVYSGGAVSAVSISSAGRLNVREGGSADNVVLQAGAKTGLFTQSTGSASVAVISGNRIGGLATGLNGAGTLDVIAGGALQNTVFSSGNLALSSGAQGSGVVMAGGSLNVLSGASVAVASIGNGAHLSVAQGGVATGVTVLNGGKVQQFVQTGASAASIQRFANGQVAGLATDLDFDGALYAGAGAQVSRTTVNSGVMVLNSGASASDLNARSFGTIIVSSGAVAGNIAISSGGSLNFAEDAVATDVTLSSGGTIRTFTQVGASPAHLNKLTGGAVTGSATGLDFTGTLNVGLGGDVVNASVESSGVMNVMSGGAAHGGSILSGGEMNVESASLVSGATVLAGGTVEVKDGASVQGLTQQAGGLVNVAVTKDGTAQVDGTNELGAFRLSGGTATNFVVYENGSMIVSSGASASGILIRSGGVMSASLAADVSGSSVDMGIRFSISNGIRSGLNTLSNFELLVESGYQVNGQVLRGGGVQSVSFGGVVDSTTVSSGGRLEIDYGATATNVNMKNGAQIDLDVYGVAGETRVTGVYADVGSRAFSLDSGVAYGFDLGEGCSMTVYSGGSAVNTTLLAGGVLVVSSGAAVSSLVQDDGAVIQTVVSGGDKKTVIRGSKTAGGQFTMANGVASSFLLESGGSLDVYSNGNAVNTDIRDGGSMTIKFGGTATGTRVSSGGSFVAQDSATVSGLVVDAGADATLGNNVSLAGNIVIGGEMTTLGALSASTATVNLYIAGQTAPQDYVLVDNLGAYSDAAGFRITIATDQAKGTYKLADGAAGFNRSVIVSNTSGVAQAITVGGTVVLGGLACTLNLADTELSLSVTASASKPNPSDLNADGRADVILTIDQPGHGADGATGAWLIQSNQTAAWGDLSQRNSGWEIFGMGHTSAGKQTADVYVRSSDNVIGAWTTGSTGAVSGWETVGMFDDQTEILGLGDFNGNGQTDLLLRNKNGAVGCYFTGGEKTGWNYFQSLGDEWKLSAVGDLNGDGRDDVVLKHDAGFTGSWLTQADGTMAWADLDTLQEGFEIVGAGDFNGDGTSDVLLRTGTYYGAWLVQNGSVSSWMGLGDLGSVTVEQIADFDSDGIDDLRIRTSAGDLGTQLVRGADNLDWKYYGSVGNEWSTSLASL